MLFDMSILGNRIEPIIDTLRMKELLRDTIDKRGKIARMVDSGELIQLRRGLYATRDLDPFAVAASIYGPSYISYETALSYHGAIPEGVFEVTSATMRRPKEFENRLGRFRFRRVPEAVYPIGIERVTDADVPFLIACVTKAICDRIALEPRMRSMRDVHRWAELMRLEPPADLDMSVIDACAERYRRPSVRLLQRTIDRHESIHR